MLENEIKAVFKLPKNDKFFELLEGLLLELAKDPDTENKIPIVNSENKVICFIEDIPKNIKKMSGFEIFIDKYRIDGIIETNLNTKQEIINHIRDLSRLGA